MDDIIKGYRLVKKTYADTAFTGYGSAKFGGRWNSPGRSCVYLSDCESLAMLEVLVHATADDILNLYALFEISLDPNSLMFARNLPQNWRDEPAPHSTVAYGDQWLESKTSLGLKLPSVIVPRQYNFLLNNEHSDFSKAIESVVELPFTFDPRLK